MRLISLGDSYKPLIHDILKTATIMMVIEFIQFFMNKDPILDKVFRRNILYQLGGLVVFYLLIDPVIGSAGEPCCSLRSMIGIGAAPATAEAPKQA